MATLQTIRNRGGLLVSIVIGLALIAFIVGDALNSGSRIFNSQRNQIGEIAGEGVSIIDFQNRVSKNEEMIKAMNNVSSLNEEQQTMLRENTWQQMIMEQLMQREYDEIGIDVSGDELYDALLGENMSPALRQLFTNPNTGSLFVSAALRRERHAAPLQWRVRSAGVPPNLQPARRSMSAATDAIGRCVFIGTLYELEVPSRDCHVASLLAMTI